MGQANNGSARQEDDVRTAKAKSDGGNDLRGLVSPRIWRSAVDQAYATWAQAPRRDKSSHLLSGPALSWAESELISNPENQSHGVKQFILASLAKQSEATSYARAAYDQEETRRESRYYWVVIAASAFTIAMIAPGIIQQWSAPTAKRVAARQKQPDAPPTDPVGIAAYVKKSIERAINGPPNPDVERWFAEAGARGELKVATVGAASELKAVPARPLAGGRSASASPLVNGRTQQLSAQELRLKEFQRLVALSNREADAGDRRRALLIALEAIQGAGQVAGNAAGPGIPPVVGQAEGQVVGQPNSQGANPRDGAAPASTGELVPATDASSVLYQLMMQRTPVLAPATQWKEPAQLLLCKGGRWVIGSAGDRSGAWDTTQRSPLASIAGDIQLPHAGVVDPQCERLLRLGDDYSVELVSLRTGATLARLVAHTDDVAMTTFSAGGQHVLTASRDGTAIVWTARTGQQTATLRGHEGPLVGGLFSPDGRHVLTWSEDKTARIWDAGTGKPLATLQGHVSAVTGGEFSPPGDYVVTLSQDGTARLWRASGGTAAVLLQPQQSSIISATFSPDGLRVATVTQSSLIEVWETRSGKPVAKIATGDDIVRKLAFSANGQQLLTLAWSGRIALWETVSGQKFAEVNAKGPPAVTVAYAAGEAGVIAVTRDGALATWPVYPNLEQTIVQARQMAGGCLSLEERSALGLAAKRPSWCAGLGKAPGEATGAP